MNRREGRNITVWDRPEPPDWRSGCATVVVIAALAFLLGLTFGVNVASRPVQTTAPSPSTIGFDDPQASPGLTLRTTVAIGYGVASASSAPTESPQVEIAAIEAGLATWYDDGPGLYGAVPSWHFGDRPYRVVVSSGGKHVIVTVRDFCACPGARIIDLSPSAFRQLASLSRGVIPVTIEDLTGITPPSTDTEAP